MNEKTNSSLESGSMISRLKLDPDPLKNYGWTGYQIGRIPGRIINFSSKIIKNDILIIPEIQMFTYRQKSNKYIGTYLNSILSGRIPDIKKAWPDIRSIPLKNYWNPQHCLLVIKSAGVVGGSVAPDFN